AKWAGDRNVISVTAIGGYPLVRTGSSWHEADRRAVRTIAVDGNRFRIHHDVAGIEQLECNRTGWEVAAFQVGCVSQRQTCSDDHRRAWRCHDRRMGRIDGHRFVTDL